MQKSAANKHQPNSAQSTANDALNGRTDTLGSTLDIKSSNNAIECKETDTLTGNNDVDIYREGCQTTNKYTDEGYDDIFFNSDPVWFSQENEFLAGNKGTKRRINELNTTDEERIHGNDLKKRKLNINNDINAQWTMETRSHKRIKNKQILKLKIMRDDMIQFEIKDSNEIITIKKNGSNMDRNGNDNDSFSNCGDSIDDDYKSIKELIDQVKCMENTETKIRKLYDLNDKYPYCATIIANLVDLMDKYKQPITLNRMTKSDHLLKIDELYNQYNSKLKELKEIWHNYGCNIPGEMKNLGFCLYIYANSMWRFNNGTYIGLLWFERAFNIIKKYPEVNWYFPEFILKYLQCIIFVLGGLNHKGYIKYIKDPIIKELLEKKLKMKPLIKMGKKICHEILDELKYSDFKANNKEKLELYQSMHDFYDGFGDDNSTLLKICKELNKLKPNETKFIWDIAFTLKQLKQYKKAEIWFKKYKKKSKSSKKIKECNEMLKKIHQKIKQKQK